MILRTLAAAALLATSASAAGLTRDEADEAAAGFEAAEKAWLDAKRRHEAARQKKDDERQRGISLPRPGMPEKTVACPHCHTHVVIDRDGQVMQGQVGQLAHRDQTFVMAWMTAGTVRMLTAVEIRIAADTRCSATRKWCASM